MTERIRELIEKLAEAHSLALSEYQELVEAQCPEAANLLAEKAIAVRRAIYGNAVYVRGLIEISNICRNDCLYCGIRRSNAHCERYRLSEEEILACGEEGYRLGFRTFVLQGGEDPFFTDQVLAVLSLR